MQRRRINHQSSSPRRSPSRIKGADPSCLEAWARMKWQGYPFQSISRLNIDDSVVITLDYQMNRQRCTRTFPAALVMVLFLAVSVFGSEGTLLCFGEDGHVAVEFVDTCNNSGFDSELGRFEGDQCGPCKDVQFPSSPAYLKNTTHYVQAPPLLFSTAMYPLPSSGQHLNSSGVVQGHRPDTTLASLHSVVLLI